MDGGAVCWRNATEPSSSPALITVCVFLSALWTIFWSVLSPQLQGRVVTTCLRFFLKKTRVSVGSISLNLAAGRILFKDVFFADIDNSFRVCDGFISFPWWRRQKSHASLTGESVQYNAFVLQLNGFHYHWYNRDEAYKLMTGKYQSDSTIEDMPSRAKNSYSWHRYLPVLQCRLTKGSMMFGNSNVPTSLVVYFDSALANYSVSSATNPFDEFLHVVVFHGSNMKAYLQPSVGYSGQYELPPVSEDKGFLFAQSDSAVITYAYDVPGIVQTEQMEGPGPRLSFAIEFGSNTVVNYGPWAHRQRFFLQRLFVPHDYKDAPITELPKLGEQRITKQLDVTFYTTKGIEICLLFRDCKSISRLQLTAGRDSHISISQPWVTQEEGYTTQIYGQVWQPQFTTSLPYPQAANGKSLEINVSLHFPRKWNHKQTWTMNFSAEAVACVIMIHFVDFFDALLTDWWGQDPSDFCFFVPLEWKMKVKICSYEVFVVTNRFNWMDVSPGQSENTRLAFCGQTGELIFELPLTIFMPLEQKVHFSAAGQSLVVRRYLPPSCTTQKSVSNMAVANRQRWRFPKVLMNDASLNCATRDLFPMGVCFSTRSEDGWIDLAAGPEITIALNYISRRNDGLDSKIRQGVIPLSNSVDVQVKIPDAVVRLFGFLARDLYAVKENFIGDYPFMNTFDSTKVNGVIVRSDIPEPVVPNQPSPSTSQLVDNILSQRFLDIHVDIMLLDVTADFPVHPSILNDHNCPLPSGYCSCLHLSVDYRMDGTQVMLSVEKISVLLPGKTSAEDCLGEVGCLVCPQVQITAQGYTEPLHHERVEYAWMINVAAHDVVGSVAVHQVPLIVEWVESAALHAISPGDSVIEAPGACVIAPKVEPLSELLKYKLLAVTVTSINLDLYEKESDMLLQVPGCEIKLCNLQTTGFQWSISGLVSEVNLVCLGTVNSGHSAKPQQEFLKAVLNDFSFDIRLKGTMHKDRQTDFLLTADRRTKRLSFLWPPCVTTSHTDIPVCGCYGGCQFTSSYLDNEAELQKIDKPCAVDAEDQASTAAVFDIMNPCDIARIHSFLFSIPPESLSHKVWQRTSYRMHSLESAPFETGSTASLESFHSALSYVSISEQNAGFGSNNVQEQADETVNQQGSTELSLTEYSQSVYSVPITNGVETCGLVQLKTFTTGGSTPFPVLHWDRMKKRVDVAEESTETESNISIQVELKDSLTITSVPQAFQILSKFVETLTTALASQASMSVLDLTMLVTQIELESSLRRSQATPKEECDQDSKDSHSALCFCLSMAPDAYISAQLLDYCIGAESMSLITAFTNDLTVGLMLKPTTAQPQGPPYESDNTCNGSSMNDQASSYGLSVTVPVIQFDVSSLSTTTGHTSSGTLNKLLSFELCCVNGECIPLVQLTLNEVSVTALGLFQKSKVISKLLTFSDITKEVGHVPIEQTNSLSDVIVSAELKLIQCHVIHTLQCYPNMVQHVDTLTRHCRQFVSPAIQSTFELIETITETRKARLCSCLLSAVSQSGRFLPKFTCLLSESARKLRDTPVFQCLQQLISLPDANVADTMDLPPKDIERMIFSLASALSAKLYVVTSRQPKSPGRSIGIQEKVKSSTGARRISQHSIASQGSLQPGVMDRMGASTSRCSSKSDTQLYRRIFQKLGTDKIELLVHALSPWLGSTYKKHHSEQSLGNFSMTATVAETSLTINVPGSPACLFVQLGKLAITGMGSLNKVLHLRGPHSRLQLQGQLFVQLNGVYVHVSAAVQKLMAIVIIQAIQLPQSELSQAHPNPLKLDSEVQVQATQNSDFGYSILHCFEETVMHFEEDELQTNVQNAHQFNAASPCDSQHIIEEPSDAMPLLPEPAVRFMSPSVSSRDEKVATSLSTVERNLTDFQKPTFLAISASIQMDIAQLHVLVEVETLQGILKVTQSSALCTLSTMQSDQDNYSSSFGSCAFSAIVGLHNATLEFADTNWELSSLMKLGIPDVTVLLALNGGLETCLKHQLVFNVSGVDFDLRQPPVILQKVVHLHIPAFKALYHEVMSAVASSEKENSLADMLKDKQPMDKPLSLSKVLAVIGRGCSLVSIRRVALLVTVLPSLTLLYSATSYSVTMESDCHLKATLSCAMHNLKFSPKTQMEDIPVRNVNLPSFEVSTLLAPREKEMLPSISLALSINKIDLHLSTEILNQLLVVQSSFVKEVDELVDIAGEIPQSVPNQTSTQAQSQEVISRESTSIDSLLSSLQTVQFSVQGIDVTVSTPSLTAVRFTTGRIEVLINNVQSATREYLLCLSGKVEIDIHFALGVFQDVSEDTDFFTELAVFTTRLSVKDTSQISDSGSDEPDLLPLDTYTLVIHSPHFFIQPSAVEQGLTFWLHCKVAYSYWQEERNAVNDEVQRATEHLLQRIHKPGEASIPKLDFARPKLVQITVSDVGVCIPLTASPMNTDSRPKAIPALVVTIQEMRISINVLKKIAVVGRFAGFCARFSDGFTVRQKQWSADHRRKGLENSAIVPRGSCKMCLGIKSREGSNRIGIVSTLQWDMSGIDLHAKHDIGQQISSLARTVFSVSGDSDRTPVVTGTPPGGEPVGPSSKLPHVEPSLAPPLNVMERNLGQQGRRVHQMKRKGGGIEYIEQLTTLREMERDTVRKLKTGSMKDRRLSVLNFKDAFLKSLASRPSDLPNEDDLAEKKMGAQGVTHSTVTSATSPRPSSRIQHRRAHSEILSDSQMKWISEREPAMLSEGLAGAEHKKGTSSIQDYILDVDVNISVNIASGSVSLHMASPSVASSDIPSTAVHSHVSGIDEGVGFWSPAVPRAARSAGPSAHLPKRGDIMVVLLPALNVRANYASDFVKGLDDSSSLDSNSDNQQREGTLILSVSVQSLEREVVLSPSLPVFLEQVAQPITSATKDFSSKMDITSPDEEEGDSSEASETSSLTFPIHVFIQFHLKPSTIILSCEPISHVQCSIGIPDVCLASSFSLFTEKEMDVSMKESLEPQSYVATFNDFSVTGCLSSFYVSLTCPPISSSVLQRMKAESVLRGPRKVFSLQMGLASLHISRKTFMAKTGAVIHDKQYISVVAEVASVLLGFDMRQLNNATAFRKCWYRKSLSEAILFGNRSAIPSEPKSDSSSVGEPVSATVIVSADISDLTFSANFAQVMGDAGIVLTHFELQSHADILRNELVQFICRTSVQSVDVDAKGGIVAGVISVSNAEFGLSTNSHEGQKPVHDAYAQVGCIDCRVDYMGAIQLMGKATCTDFHICEQWQGSSTDEGQRGLPGVTIVVTFNWDSVKLIICKSTTRSIVNIIRRLTDFIIQQKARSETTLKMMLPSGINTQGPLQTLVSTSMSQARSSSEATASSTTTEDVLKHHHWLWATQEQTSSMFQALGIYSLEASRNMSLGGEVQVAGGSFYLACLHGTSFNEKEWALFNLQAVKATFGTQAIPCLAEMDGGSALSSSKEELVRVCQQRLHVLVGQEAPQQDGKQYGGVYHMTSGRAGIPLLSSNTNIDDWLMYRCIEAFLSGAQGEASTNLAQRYARHVVVEPILTIPAVSFDLTNDHFWPSSEILTSTTEIVPKVKCHLETGFSQGISITAYAQRYAFLHEVITSYIDNLEQQPSGKAPLDKGTLNLHCNREFVCETWVLNPTLVLIAGERWPSGRLNPHVSLLLDWLGFKEAKVTIPKWIQRGAMDPADLLFSKLVQAILTFSARKKTLE